MKARSSEGVALSGTLVKSTSNGMNVKESAKPFGISKRDVWDAYKRVKANRGAAGVDGQSIDEFEENLSANLYKLWNRLASGSYFPPPVRRVEIPKGDGRTRPLGIPTVADRIAQMVVTRFLQPILEPHFHADSYGYRPGKSAKEALGRCTAAMLAQRLGARSRHQSLFRDDRSWPLDARGSTAYDMRDGFSCTSKDG